MFYRPDALPAPNQQRQSTEGKGKAKRCTNTELLLLRRSAELVPNAAYCCRYSVVSVYVSLLIMITIVRPGKNGRTDRVHEMPLEPRNTHYGVFDLPNPNLGPDLLNILGQSYDYKIFSKSGPCIRVLFSETDHSVRESGFANPANPVLTRIH